MARALQRTFQIATLPSTKLAPCMRASMHVAWRCQNDVCEELICFIELGVSCDGIDASVRVVVPGLVCFLGSFGLFCMVVLSIEIFSRRHSGEGTDDAGAAANRAGVREGDRGTKKRVKNTFI